MSTIIIENQSKITKNIFTSTESIQKIKISEWINLLKKSFYNQDRETYWPFEDEEAINFLKLLDYEDRIS